MPRLCRVSAEAGRGTEGAMDSFLSRTGRVLLLVLYAAGMLAGGFLLLCRLGVLSPAAVAALL